MDDEMFIKYSQIVADIDNKLKRRRYEEKVEEFTDNHTKCRNIFNLYNKEYLKEYIESIIDLIKKCDVNNDYSILDYIHIELYVEKLISKKFKKIYYRLLSGFFENKKDKIISKKIMNGHLNEKHNLLKDIYDVFRSEVYCHELTDFIGNCYKYYETDTKFNYTLNDLVIY